MLGSQTEEIVTTVLKTEQKGLMGAPKRTEKKPGIVFLPHLPVANLHTNKATTAAAVLHKSFHLHKPQARATTEIMDNRRAQNNNNKNSNNNNKHSNNNTNKKTNKPKDDDLSLDKRWLAKHADVPMVRTRA